MDSRPVVLAVGAQALLVACAAALPAAFGAHLYATSALLVLIAAWIATVYAWRVGSKPAAVVPAPEPAQAREAAGARLLASLLDQTPAPLLTCEADGAVRARNRAARMLFRTDDRVREPPPALLSELDRGGSRDRLTMLVGEGEASRTYAVSLTDLRAADGPVRLAVLLDIEPELRAAEARALRELMQVLSHEIMNALTPVASLAGTVEELLAEGGLDALGPAREAVGVLARRAEGLARFAASYRALARLPPPSRVPTSVAGLIAEAARLFDSRWTPLGVTLTVEPPHSDIRADLDPDQIMQAVLNLLANAADAALQGSPDGPRVLLSARLGRGGGLVLTVADNGCGVAEADRDRVFQPFFTTKPEGTGVGLSLSRQVARAHGGELGLAAARPTGGAAFELRL